MALLEVLRRRGNVAEALVAYDEFRMFLRDELGTAPGRELLALHEDAAARRAGRRRRHRAGAAARRAAQRLPDRLAQALAAPWVGREAALARLREQADAGGRGRAAELVLVVGEGGIGKTRLVAELAAGLAGFDVLYGRCDEEEIFPYGPWVDMLRPRLEPHGRRGARRGARGRGGRPGPARAGDPASACRAPAAASPPATRRRSAGCSSWR